MTDFYVFEGSFFQGGGGWEELWVCTDAAEVRKAAEGYLRDGHWTFSPRSETFEIAVYHDGSVRQRLELYPHTRIEVPGLTPIGFGPGAETRGGAPDPEGRFAESTVASVWEDVDILNTLVEERFAGVTTAIDWDAVGLPELTGPRLSEYAELLLDEERGSALVVDTDRFADDAYLVGLVSAIAERDRSAAKAGQAFLAELPDMADPDERGDAMTELLYDVDAFRQLQVGYNSLFE